MELELIEPALFLTSHPAAADRFADAILAAVAGSGIGSSRPALR
jgi:hypothetical protein